MCNWVLLHVCKHQQGRKATSNNSTTPKTTLKLRAALGGIPTHYTLQSRLRAVPTELPGQLNRQGLKSTTQYEAKLIIIHVIHVHISRDNKIRSDCMYIVHTSWDNKIWWLTVTRTIGGGHTPITGDQSWITGTGTLSIINVSTAASWTRLTFLTYPEITGVAHCRVWRQRGGERRRRSEY